MFGSVSLRDFPEGLAGKESTGSPGDPGDVGSIPGLGKPPGGGNSPVFLPGESPGYRNLEKEMATHCSVLVWRIPGTGEHGELPSMGSQRVGHD